jgi:hypothetical protein
MLLGHISNDSESTSQYLRIVLSREDTSPFALEGSSDIGHGSDDGWQEVDHHFRVRGCQLSRVA